MQDILKVPLEAEQDFSKFLKRIRIEEKVYLEQLAEGLMTVTQLARIEKGQRPIPKSMRDRLLGRLGVASDLYENLLNVEDYAAWEHQRDILCAVEQRDMQRAQNLIAAYEVQTPTKDTIKRQFCLMMRAEVLRQQKAESHKIAVCYEEAAKQTIPDIEQLCLERKLLSIQEVNMILEYEFYHKGKDFARKCRELMTFVENAVYDDLSKVKIYPKIVYYYLQEVFLRQRERTIEKLKEHLQICNQAIEMLRNTGRAFYLLELLEIKIKILECMEIRAGKQELESEYQESIKLANLFKTLYAKYDVSAYMQDCTYLYQQRWVFYIGDVLRIRREMYGLTQKQLCEGICSVRTLRRAEKRETNMQHEFLDALLRKLGLSKEFQRTRLVTNDREVLRLRTELLMCRNNRDFNRSRALLKQIREKISLEIPENRQYMIELEASLDWMEGKITKEELIAREDEALCCTLKTEKLPSTGDIFLTEMEVSCIRKKIDGLEGSKKEEYINFLLHFFEQNERKCILPDCIVMYEYVMIFLASELGNMGRCQLAMGLDRKILKEDLACKRVWIISIILYDILWNEVEQKVKNGELIDKEKMTKGLEQCLLLSHFCKQTFYEKFYKEKLH